MQNITKFFKKYSLLIILIICLTLVAVPTVFYIKNFYNHEISSNSEHWGQFGDFFGGTLNPIFAFLTFSALLYTIHLQQKTIKVSTEELELTRQELTRSADAQTNAQLVMKQQLQTQNSQQFDSIFFAMLRELNALLENLEKKPPIEAEHRAIRITIQPSPLDKVHNSIFFANHSSISAIHNNLLQEKNIAQYFMLLYQLLKIIDTKISGDQGELTKKMYSNIVRASLSEKILQLLIVNVSYPEFEKYRRLIEKFSFFEHVSFKIDDYDYNFILINLVAKLNKIAFGDSIYFKTLQKSIMYSKFIPNNGILNLSDLYKIMFMNLNNHQMMEDDIIDSKTYYQLFKEINGIEHKIFLNHNTFETTLYQTITMSNPSLCHTYIDDNGIGIYNAKMGLPWRKLIYAIEFQKDGEVTIQYKEQS